jgi:flavorubredoxin
VQVTQERGRQSAAQRSGLKMGAREITAGVQAVGAIDWDRRLFDELIPLPEGTSYNSYLVRGSERTALIDTVDPTKTPVLLGNLAALGVERLDYVVANHAEQDHSGSLPAVLSRYPEARVVATPKGKDLLVRLLGIAEERFLAVGDRERLSLGGKTLEFLHLPWVHWPETMITFLAEDGILFTCDFLGSHLATGELYSRGQARVYEAAKRYFAEIMMPFRGPIQGHLEKVNGLAPRVVAPSHGPLHDDPRFILDAYREWASDQVTNEVVLPFVSMHGTTRRMVDYLGDALLARGIGVRRFDLSVTDLGKLATALVDAASVVFGSPTVLAGLHPQVVYAAYLANALRPKTRFASLIGSFGWGGRMVEQLTGLVPNLKVEFLEPVVVKGFPGEEDFRALDRLADALKQRHQTL